VDTIPRTHEEYRQWWQTNYPSIPFGECLCSCGEKTNIASRNRSGAFHFSGEPFRYIAGHHKRLQTPAYTEEDRGFPTSCWIWQRSKNNGYGMTSEGKDWRPAYRVYYEREHGPVPKGQDLHHRCEQPACVRPDHLTPLTRAKHVEQRSTTKLTPAKVMELRRLRRTSNLSYQALGEMFGIEAPHACAIVKGKYWKHIPLT
jgi:hypothetical protein